MLCSFYCLHRILGSSVVPKNGEMGTYALEATLG